MATVLCVLQTSGFRGNLPLIHLPGGCRITSGHPVRISLSNTGHQSEEHPARNYKQFTECIKPNRIAAHRSTACTTLCALILEDSPSFWIQGTECLALGHDQTSGDASHPFYGTDL
eukprot:9970753-Heterocapsa_arctica.AAC.1